MNATWPASVSARAPISHAEDDLQAAIVQHLRLLAPRTILWFAVPNGGLRSKRSAARLKATGVVAGVPDLAFVLADGKAAFMELKASGGRLSPEQKVFQKRCADMDVEHAVVFNIDTALTILRAWGCLPREAH